MGRRGQRGPGQGRLHIADSDHPSLMDMFNDGTN